MIAAITGDEITGYTVNVLENSLHFYHLDGTMYTSLGDAEYIANLLNSYEKGPFYENPIPEQAR